MDEDKVVAVGPYGIILIDMKLEMNGASRRQLCKKLRASGINMSDQSFHNKVKKPYTFTVKEIRAIAVLLGLTAEEIYNSFIMLRGWPEYDELVAGSGENAGDVQRNNS